ncbi:ATP-binding protein [Rhodohalobacter barkolensis]|uniref:AAA family ATPase n=1 Tax=Rhodohalobacter barkolensis TaxID=2053187 RepID=A0A2N0VH92_9BACT|nr:AAA family ATPase [Rhodohalobacter barkolensis]PKD43561.1 AAA family ATPase [Rhodohalobacter barkolensis]
MLTQYPRWAQFLAKKYLSRTLNQFILHGNVHDLVSVGDGSSTNNFLRLKTFLAEDFFGARDIVIFYDRSSGIYFRDQETQKDFNRALSGRDTIAGTDYSKKLPKDPVGAFSVLEQYFRVRLEQKKSIALIIDYAETIIPANEAGSTGTEDRNALVYLLKWAHDPLFLASDFTTTLLTENMADLNRSLVQNPYTSSVRITLPNEDERLNYLVNQIHPDEFEKISKVPKPVVAQMTAGLGYLKLKSILSNAVENGETITFQSLTTIKKELIESEAYGLIEFIPSQSSLDAVAGHGNVKKHLRSAVEALKHGRRDVLPMGYLVCGPVGTGKTFLVTSFAGEVGIPMVKLKNFRSQWQGVTEGNLEKILTLLKAMAPVAVMIDEADAYLGDRSASGDSGVSSRVFSQIATAMSDTSNRGRILWFLMTARPDLMPIDLKRQGRAEEHISLFPPDTLEERVELFDVMKKKTNLKLSEEYVPKAVKKDKTTYSGADMEAALTRAKFRAASQGLEEVTPELLDDVFEDFIPPTYPEEVELQTLVAVTECTSKALLPEQYRKMDREKILNRIEELKMTIR